VSEGRKHVTVVLSSRKEKLQKFSYQLLSMSLIPGPTTFEEEIDTENLKDMSPVSAKSDSDGK
jgi:hypothetical protein